MNSRPFRECASLLPVTLLATALNLLLLSAPLMLMQGAGGIVENPAPAAFLALASGWCIIEGSVAHAGGRRVRTTSGPRWLPLAIGGALLLTYWIALADAALLPRVQSLVAWAAGAMLMPAGIALRYLAIRRLGVYFLNEVAVLPGQPLVTDGVYAVIRHPSETGTLCLAFGGAALLGSPAGLLVCAVVLLPCVMWRTRLEDAVLRERHPIAFERYAREVAALLPGVRRTGPM